MRRNQIGVRHTAALRYSLLERLRFRLAGRWPESVVDRRLAAWDNDSRELATLHAAAFGEAVSPQSEQSA